MKKNKLIQLSTKWCGPCKSAKAMIEKQYSPDKDTYIFADIEDRTNIFINKLVDEVNPRSVPTFVVFNSEENKITEVWAGANPQKITEYFESGEEE